LGVDRTKKQKRSDQSELPLHIGSL